MAIPKSELKLLRNLLGYSARAVPILLPITLLGLVSSLLELGAMTSIVPLGILAGGNKIGPQSFWHRVPNALGLPSSAKFYVMFFLILMMLRMASVMAIQVMNSYAAQTLMGLFSTRAHAAFVRHLSFRDIFRQQIGHFVALAGDEANRGAQIVVGVMRLLPVVFLFLIYIALIFYQSWKGGVALGVLFTVLVASLGRAFRESVLLGERQQQESRIAGTHFIESLSGLRTVRGFTAENFVISHYVELMRKYMRTLFLNDVLAQLTQMPAIMVIVLTGIAVAFYADSAMLIQNMPFFLAGIMMFTRLLPIANQGLEAVVRLTANLRAGRSVAEMLQTIHEADERDQGEEFPSDERITNIVFDRVCFRYSNDTPLVLDNFSYRFEAGATYAIVGPSGAGKSSLIDLLLRFFEPDTGTIRVNGRDIAAVSSASLRQHIVLAEQAPRMFYGTVLENVVFGHHGDGMDAERALTFVGLRPLLDSLPQGASTVLNFQGSNLSGGQRQRVGIARALVRSSDVLVLDEGTSALDITSRNQVMDKLLDEYRDKILVFVTHDPQVIGRVDHVIELQSRQVQPAQPVSA